jgi:hypothetical protein
VTCDAAFIDGQSACLLLSPAARHQTPCFGIGKIKITQLGYRLCIARCSLLGGRIALTGDVAQQAPGLLPRPFGRPRSAVPADREPTLAAFLGAIEQHIRDGIAVLPPRSEADQRLVPDRFPRPERSHLSQSNPAPHGHCHRPLDVAC